MGMKVSLTRASGQMSRGTVKWLGLLPHHQGDYVGVELESESKFFFYISYLSVTVSAFLAKATKGSFEKK